MNINSAFPSNYIKSDDVPQPIECSISHVAMERMADGEDKPVLYFQGGQKGLVLNKTNATMLGDTFGYETEGWAGKVVTLKAEPTTYAGRSVMGLRVYPIQGQQQQMPQQQRHPNDMRQDAPPQGHPAQDDIPF